MDGDGIKFKYNLRFAGQYFDAETKLHYNYFRDYDPQIGRYLSSDPIGLAGGLNTYGYALQNTLSYTDPTGEAVPALLWGISGAVLLWDMMRPSTPHPVYPDAIESVVTLPGPLGKIGSSKKLCEVTKNLEDILVLGRGTPNELNKSAKLLKGRVIDNSAIIHDSKALFKHIHGEMRKADRIIQIMDDIPDKLVSGRGNGQWSRAEKIFIDNNQSKFADKMERINRSDIK